MGLNSGEPNFYAYVSDSNSWVDVFGLASNPFQFGTYGGLKPMGKGLQAHELLRHEFLRQQGLANSRLSGNPSIALDKYYHTKAPTLVEGKMTNGGAHWHERRIRASQGLSFNEFKNNLKRELDIVQGALRKAGIPASSARRLRKEAEAFYNSLKTKKHH
ncbi:hypothetical protein A5M85_03870 [Cellulophaga lytica]|nr:hypothetical protein A5M85_03870 [Cellulophaga lytica]